MQTSFTMRSIGVSLCAGLLNLSLCGAMLSHPTIALAQGDGGAAAGCVGDCGGNLEVTVNELITMVNIALGTAQLSACAVGDSNGDGEITVNEIITAVNNALNACPAGNGVCGDGHVDSGEDCDNGGICIGGTNAGTSCTSESTCQGQGSCIDGPQANWACNSDSDCPTSKCLRCRPFGGDGCAANCTTESRLLVPLKAGALLDPNDPLSLDPTTSGIIVHGDILSITIPFPEGGSQALTVGKAKDGKLPGVLKAVDIDLPTLPVQTLACACLRGLELKSCGGTLNEVNGTPSTDCTDGFSPANACDGKKPCASVFGPGNGGMARIGCESLDGANLTVTQDSGGGAGAKPQVITLSGVGGAGSVVVQTATSLGFVIGSCSGSGPEYGPDGQFCTFDDSLASRGTVVPSTYVSGMATATVHQANGDPTLDIGPYSSTGAPLMCSDVANGNASGSILAGAFIQLGAETIGDIAITDTLAAE
jgi:hypothetical protein